MIDVASKELESKITLDLSEFKQEILDADLKGIRSEIELLAQTENISGKLVVKYFCSKRATRTNT